MSSDIKLNLKIYDEFYIADTDRGTGIFKYAFLNLYLIDKVGLYFLF